MRYVLILLFLVGCSKKDISTPIADAWSKNEATWKAQNCVSEETCEQAFITAFLAHLSDYYNVDANPDKICQFDNGDCRPLASVELLIKRL